MFQKELDEVPIVYSETKMVTKVAEYAEISFNLEANAFDALFNWNVKQLWVEQNYKMHSIISTNFYFDN